MTLYARTEEGQKAAYSQESTLPTKLKSLLKVVDGKTTMDVYVQALDAFGDVNSIFASLLSAGLIEPVQLNQPMNKPIASAHEQGILLQSTFREEWSETKPASKRGAITKTVRLENDLHTGALPPSEASILPTQGNLNQGSLQEHAAQLGLKQAIDLMSDFVILHLPAQSFVVLKELEELQNMEQLAATFGGYEQIVKQAGEPSAAHLQQLRRLVTEHL